MGPLIHSDAQSGFRTVLLSFQLKQRAPLCGKLLLSAADEGRLPGIAESGRLALQRQPARTLLQ
ncbi:hypothetical protein D3C72_2476110 [compost metagenome]